MRGAENLIKLRMSGRRPAVVFLNDYLTPTMCLDGSTVDISGDDLIGLDLRFLTGLTVSTSSHTEERARAILEACKRAGAVVVACCHMPENWKDRKPTDYVEIWNANHPT